MAQGQFSSDQPARAWRPAAGGPPSPVTPKQTAGPTISNRWRRIFAALATITALGAAVGALLWFIEWPVEPYFVALPISEYGPPLLANEWAEKDSDALLSLFQHRRNASNYTDERKRLEGELDALGGKKEPIVVYLRGHGVKQDGQVYIVPATASLDRPETLLPLIRVLKSLGDCKSAKKLLILHITPARAVSTSVVSNEDVKQCVNDYFAKAPKPTGTAVFFVCGFGEPAGDSKEAAVSVFAHYLIKGLAGEAAGYDRKKKTGYVSVEALSEFVADGIDNWAKRNGIKDEKPVLIGEGASGFFLAPGRQPNAPVKAVEAKKDDLPK